MKTEHEPYLKMLSALARCSFLPGCWDKRFVNDMLSTTRPVEDFTGRQCAAILRLVHKYRRQVPVEIIILAQDHAESEATP